ncbi:MarR family winged helix-turn-helix transcriptional regulator [Gordonia sp. HS-NH1]|uniref:MarR family winged helix-turn-helix transcriptional regulator n=1 Tax=Gordonia sp. HS-NH1 TaxID=1435068 RepID=UPI0006E325E5|nr:MarR family winged helix-turn-helix transcriptional regulator [Gordonia sp. HS-NH1]
MTEQLIVLQALRLKGRVRADDLADSVGLDSNTMTADLEALVAAGFAAETNGRYKTTPEGRTRLAELLDAERATLDTDALTSAYEEFDAFNDDLKALMTRWQLKDESTPNDHSDAAYDAAIVTGLRALHERFAPLLSRVVEQAPRLTRYPTRFTAALEKVESGDTSWFARPIADSYHTVWFELHEELIGLTGRTRAAEAAAGRAL